MQGIALYFCTGKSPIIRRQHNGEKRKKKIRIFSRQSVFKWRRKKISECLKQWQMQEVAFVAYITGTDESPRRRATLPIPSNILCHFRSAICQYFLCHFISQSDSTSIPPPKPNTYCNKCILTYYNLKLQIHMRSILLWQKSCGISGSKKWRSESIWVAQNL